jgi:hypothetical protein
MHQIFSNHNSELQTGVKVMMTIFLRCFRRKKSAFFLKNQCYDHIFAKTNSSFSKNTNFRQINCSPILGNFRQF